MRALAVGGGAEAHAAIPLDYQQASAVHGRLTIRLCFFPYGFCHAGALISLSVHVVVLVCNVKPVRTSGTSMQEPREVSRRG